jgi:hypothetical protein
VIDFRPHRMGEGAGILDELMSAQQPHVEIRFTGRER